MEHTWGPRLYGKKDKSRYISPFTENGPKTGPENGTESGLGMKLFFSSKFFYIMTSRTFKRLLKLILKGNKVIPPPE